MTAFEKVGIFISCVSDEFGRWREDIVNKAILKMVWCYPESQEYFVNTDNVLLEDLRIKICRCRAMIHLIGQCVGRTRKERAAKDVETFMAKHDEIVTFLLPYFCNDRLAIAAMSYTQWEAWLAVYYGLDLRVFTVSGVTKGWQSTGRDEYSPKPGEFESQENHKQRLHQCSERATVATDITSLDANVFSEISSVDGLLGLWLEHWERKFQWPDKLVASLQNILLVERVLTFGPTFVIPVAISILGDVDRRVPDGNSPDIFLISELSKAARWQDLATLAYLAKLRASTARNTNAAQALSEWLQNALQHHDWSLQQLQGYALQLIRDLPASKKPEMVLEVSWESDPNAGVGRVTPVAYIRVGNRPWKITNCLGSMDKRDIVTYISEILSDNACIQACPPQRAEVFIDSADTSSFEVPWDHLSDANVSELELHEWPVVVRMRRKPHKWKRLPKLQKKIDHSKITRWTGDDVDIEARTCACGIFFCSNYAIDQNGNHLLGGLAAKYGVGLWSRRPANCEEAIETLQVLDSTSLANLPGQIHLHKTNPAGLTVWPHITLLFDHPELTVDASRRFPVKPPIPRTDRDLEQSNYQIL